MPNKPNRSLLENRRYVQRVALCGLLTALMLVLGYLESRIPLAPGIPGIKLGLSNAVLLYGVYLLPGPVTLSLMLVKVLLSALMFGVQALPFSMAGGLLSVPAMLLSKRFLKLGVVGVSVVGALLHNLGQMLVALWMVGNINLLYYMAVLTLSAIGTGILTGIVAGLVMKATEKQWGKG